MKSVRLLILVLVASVAMLFQTTVFAVEPGQPLPALDIHAGGEISVNDDDIVKKPWSSKSFESRGKVQLVQYVAADKGAVRQNKAFTDTLLHKNYSPEQLDTTIIVHLADTMAIAKGFVETKVAKNKVKHQAVSFVMDDDGLGLQAWGMKNKSFAIIVLDANGRVLFAKDGPLSENELASTIRLIEHHMS